MTVHTGTSRISSTDALDHAKQVLAKPVELGLNVPDSIVSILNLLDLDDLESSLGQEPVDTVDDEDAEVAEHCGSGDGC